jgi:hypothetical protein
MKAVTRHQLVCLLSLGPLLVARLYLTISLPVEVAVSSGAPARWPMSWSLARGRAGVVLKARSGVVAKARGARSMVRENMFVG